jgi:hypothetical protein
MIANPVSGSPIYAFSVITLMSEHKLSSQPPPRANPSITEIVGQPMFSKLLKVATIFFLNLMSYSGLISFLSLRSAPAQNMPGSALVRITQVALS